MCDPTIFKTAKVETCLEVCRSDEISSDQGISQVVLKAVISDSVQSVLLWLVFAVLLIACYDTVL